MSQPTRITHFSVSGFKSFGYPGESVQLGPLDFIVGANGSGKSNLLGALRFLQSAVMYDVEHAVNEFGGIAEVLHRRTRQRNPPGAMSFKFTIESGAAFNIPGMGADMPAPTLERFECSVNLDLGRRPGEASIVESETVSAQVRLGSGAVVKYTLRRNRENLIIEDPLDLTARSEGTVPRREYRIPEHDASRLAIGIGFFSFPCALLRHVIAGWRFFNISPQATRLPSRATAEGELGPGGEGLAVALDRIGKSEGGKLKAILSDLKSVVPGFKGLRAIHLPIESKVAYQVLVVCQASNEG